MFLDKPHPDIALPKPQPDINHPSIATLRIPISDITIPDITHHASITKNTLKWSHSIYF